MDREPGRVVLTEERQRSRRARSIAIAVAHESDLDEITLSYTMYEVRQREPQESAAAPSGRS